MMTNNGHTIRVLLVDDHPIYRVGLKMALRYSGVDCEVVAETDNVQQTVDYLKAHSHDIDLMLLDFFLTDGTAKDVMHAVDTYCPGLKVLLLSGEVVHPAVLRMSEEHIEGFINKNVKPDELKQRIEALFGQASRHDEDSDSEELSEREIEVIKLCAKGLTANEIGERLHIGKRTVETHKERIFLKLGLKSTKELINYAFRHGLTE